MRPKSIQDITSFKKRDTAIATKAQSQLIDKVEEPPGPEFVGNIPVRTQANLTESPSIIHNSFVIAEEKIQPSTLNPVPVGTSSNNPPNLSKPAKQKPTAAVLFAGLAIICFAIGGYLIFLAEA